MGTLLVLTLSGSALAVLLLALRYLILKKMPSTVYYYAWLLILLRFLLPLPGLVPGMTDIAGEESPPVSYTDAAENPDAEQTEPAAVNADPRIPPAPQAAETGDTAREQNITAVPAAAQRAVPNWRISAFWLTVWAAGAAAAFGITVFSYLRFTCRLRQTFQAPGRAVREIYDQLPGRKPALYCSRALKTPLMCGVLRPRIILPARPADGEQLTNILRHELMHFRRRDTLYKWFSAAVLSLHWFNPLAWLIRRELDRACELSCDEMLLRTMDRAEKQSYGSTLLNMAASSPLPAGVVATTFSTEKKNLKERLEQIMNYKKSGARLFAAVLALVLLTGCGMAAGPQAQKEETAETPAAASGDAVRVTNVDEFLAAIQPNRTIELAEGEYDLSTAANYAAESDNPNYTWETIWSHEKNRMEAELIITGVENLTIRGEGMDQSTITAVPRYANVIRFRNCPGLSVEKLTAGHTTEPGYCMGGVLCMEDCRDVSVSECGLYGCGTIGVEAVNTNGLSVTACHIYECSYAAVSLHQCRIVRVEDCEVYRHGIRDRQSPGMALFTASYSENIVIHNNRVYDNASQFLLQLDYTKNAAFLSNDVHDNRFGESVFRFEQYGATVDGCAFTNNETRSWVQSSGIYANDATGKFLETADFEAMTLCDIDPDTVVTALPAAEATEVKPGGSISVTTVDEFLAAIGPDRTILLDGELFDLSTASSYGSVGGEYYFWQQSYDGPELVIHDVSGLSIGASGTDREATTIAAVPRCANVLNFRNCERIRLRDFTAGHTKEPGSCAGGVLNFLNCGEVTLDNMGLYGCGVLGVQATRCTSMQIRQSEIYECSQGAGEFFRCDGLSFTGCEVRDVPSPAFCFIECGDCSWNGEAFSGENGMYDVKSGGMLSQQAD